MNNKMIRFKELAKYHFRYLLEASFVVEENPFGFSTHNIIGFTNMKVEFIVIYDDRDNVVDLYLRKFGESINSEKFDFFSYLVDRHQYRGGYLKNNIEDAVESQIVKHSQLLKAHLSAVIDDFCT